MERHQASSVEGMKVDWVLAEKVANRIANRAPFSDVGYLKGLNESFSDFTESQISSIAIFTSSVVLNLPSPILIAS